MSECQRTSNPELCCTEGHAIQPSALEYVERLQRELDKIETFRREQYERIPAVPHSQPGSYARGYDNGMADILRGLTAALAPSETSAKPPCDHPLGKLFYHGFVSGRPGDFRCDACQAVIYLPSLKAREWAAARIEMQQQSKTSGTQNAASGHECQHCKQLNADWAKWCGRCGGSLRD